MRRIHRKKGFTLVEIIVVLVILAILMAATIPSMIGFINDARGKAYAAEARVGLTAAQAVVTELVASGRGLNSAGNTYTSITNNRAFISMVNEVDGIDGEPSNIQSVFTEFAIDPVTFKVTGLLYVNTTAGWQVYIGDGLTEVERTGTAFTRPSISGSQWNNISGIIT
ncbi:MAG: type II secretion system GspH family protein [Oscillospiraceae bacterium]|nr:type II secretion system GspH family protein [Oscillospiraceae bacterium]